jgi:hypothetical protein
MACLHSKAKIFDAASKSLVLEAASFDTVTVTLRSGNEIKISGFPANSQKAMILGSHGIVTLHFLRANRKFCKLPAEHPSTYSDSAGWSQHGKGSQREAGGLARLART